MLVVSDTWLGNVQVQGSASHIVNATIAALAALQDLTERCSQGICASIHEPCVTRVCKVQWTTFEHARTNVHCETSHRLLARTHLGHHVAYTRAAISVDRVQLIAMATLATSSGQQIDAEAQATFDQLKQNILQARAALKKARVKMESCAQLS